MELREVQNFNPQNQAGGKCTFCRQHRRDIPNVTPARKCRIFSTGVHIDFEGVIEICEICLRFGAGTLGFVTPEEQEALLLTANRLDELLDEAQTELDSKTSAISLLAKELADAEERGAAKAATSYDHGWRDAMAAENPPEEPDFAGGPDGV